MNQTVTLTQNQALAAGGILGGMLATIGIFALAVYILYVIAWWKIFTKAGEPGWKAIIPIYNSYILCKIVGINFWIYALAIPVGLGILSAIPALTNVMTIVTSIYTLFFYIYLAIKLGDAFKKGTGFKVGLVLLSFIFELILAFGDSKYAGKTAVEKK